MLHLRILLQRSCKFIFKVGVINLTKCEMFKISSSVPELRIGRTFQSYSEV